LSDLTAEEFDTALQTILPVLARKGIPNPTDKLLVPLVKAHLPEDKRTGVDALVARGAVAWPSVVRQTKASA
jgi:hypothetical protein